MPLVVGLTGGIGCGKTTVLQYFQDLGVPTLSADVFAKNITEQPDIQQALVAEFGPQVLDNNKQLDRAFIRETIFNDDQKRLWLNQLLHPKIRTAIAQAVSEIAKPYVVIEVPLLIENGRFAPIDRILVVDAPEATQKQRAQVRDQRSATEIAQIMQVQAPRNIRQKQADELLINDSDLKTLQVNVAKLHEYYLNLSHSQKLS